MDENKEMQEKIEEAILQQLEQNIYFPIANKQALLEAITEQQDKVIKVGDKEKTLKEACENCDDDSVFPINSPEDFAKAISPNWYYPI